MKMLHTCFRSHSGVGLYPANSESNWSSATLQLQHWNFGSLCLCLYLCFVCCAFHFVAHTIAMPTLGCEISDNLMGRSYAYKYLLQNRNTIDASSRVSLFRRFCQGSRTFAQHLVERSSLDLRVKYLFCYLLSFAMQ